MDNRFTQGNKYVVIMGGDRKQDNLNGEYWLISVIGGNAMMSTERVTSTKKSKIISVPVTALYSHDELQRLMNPWWEPGY